MPANLAVWELFGACATQWRVGMAGPVGLDMAAVAAVATALAIELDMATMHKLRVLEAEVLRGYYGTASGHNNNRRGEKPCAHALSCAVCKKQCAARVVGNGTTKQ